MTFAVQPTAWGNFDPHGCDWAANINHAYRLASVWRAKYPEEEMMIWQVPLSGEPIRWCRADANTDAIGARH